MLGLLNNKFGREITQKDMCISGEKRRRILNVEAKQKMKTFISLVCSHRAACCDQSRLEKKEKLMLLFRSVRHPTR